MPKFVVEPRPTAIRHPDWLDTTMNGIYEIFDTGDRHSGPIAICRTKKLADWLASAAEQMNADEQEAFDRGG